MTIVKKAAISLVIALTLFTVFTIISYSTLFHFMESKFYNRKIIAEVETRIDNITNAIDEYENIRLEKLIAISNDPAITNSFLINQSSEDIFRRENIVNSLHEQHIDFYFIKVIDHDGRIHYSNNPADIESDTATSVTYRTPDVQLVERFRALIRRAGDEAIIFFDSHENFNMFVSPVYSASGVRRGAILVYLSPNDLKNYLVQRNIIRRTIVMKFLEHDNIVFNILDDSPSVLDELRTYWETEYITNPYTLYSDADGNSFSVITKKWRNGFIGYVISDSLIRIGTAYRYILLFSAFSIIYILSFLLMNLRQDQVVVIADRVKRFQINFLIEYLENKSEVEWKVWKKELENHKEEVRKKIKQGIIGLKGDRDKVVNDLIDKSWDEIISLLAGHLDKEVDKKNIAANLQVDNIEEIIRKVITSEDIVRSRYTDTTPALQVKLAPANESPEGEDKDAIELGEFAEEFGELEEILDEEELEELEEVVEEEALHESVTSESSGAVPIDEGKRFKELKGFYKDYGEEIIDEKEIQAAINEIENNIIPVNDGEDHADIERITSFKEELENGVPRKENIPELTEEIETLEPVADFKPLVVDNEYEELELLEEAEPDEDDEVKTVEYIKSNIGVYRPDYMPDSFYARAKKEMSLVKEGLSEETVVSDLENVESISFSKNLELLKQDGLLQIWTIENVLEMLKKEETKKDAPIIEKDGVFKINADLYDGADSLENVAKAEGTEKKSYILDLFADDDIMDLPIFSEEEGAEVSGENSSFSGDDEDIKIKISEKYGFYSDISYDMNEKTPIAVIKHLFKLTRKIDSGFAAILGHDDKEYYPEVSVGLFDKDYPGLLRLNKESFLAKELLDKRKILFFKTSIDKIEELSDKFSSDDSKKIKSFLFAPIRYKEKQAYIVAAPNVSTFSLNSICILLENT